MVEPYHLQGTDLKATTEDGINDLSNLFGLDCMWLDDAERAVLVVGPRFHSRGAGEDEIDFALGRGWGVAAVTSVLGSVLAVKSTQTARGFLSRLLRVGGADKLSPLGDRIRREEFHAE